MSQHFLQSSYREKLIEHLFVGELLKYSWHSRDCALAIARPEVDNSGYDIVVEEGSVVRHVQLKTAHRGASTKFQKVHRALCDKPAGCVVWIQFEEATLELGPYLFFGRGPREQLSLDGFKVAKHTKANAMGVKAERQNIRIVPRKYFRENNTIEALYAELFASV